MSRVPWLNSKVGLSLLLTVTLTLALWHTPWLTSWRIGRAIHLVEGDYTVAYLGNPMAHDFKRGRARNVWDLQGYDGKLFIAGGSTVDNVGPINIWVYDPVVDRFRREYTVQEEAIERFRVLNGDLYIPAADPTKGDLNKFYRRTNTGLWTQVAGEPELAHVRDLAYHDGRLIAVGNTRDNANQPSAIASRDGGRTFTPVTDPAQLGRLTNWFYSLFEYQGMLFATTLIFNPLLDTESILVFDSEMGQFLPDPTITTATFVPLTNDDNLRDVTLRLWRTVELDNRIIYAIRTYCAIQYCYEHRYNGSYGLFLKTSLTAEPQAVTFPEPSAVGESVLIHDGWLYALANRRLAPNRHHIFIYRSQDPTANRWESVLTMTSPNKARAFALLENTFYIGLGHEFDEPVRFSGAILRVTQAQ